VSPFRQIFVVVEHSDSDVPLKVSCSLSNDLFPVATSVTFGI